MAESVAETPESHTPKSTSRPKDRNCPFCDQAFTSSSLGRHLDLYIREKNPKPPDGKHDVEKIKQIRQGITRRNPRKREESVVSSAQVGTSTSSAAPASEDGSPKPDPTPSLNYRPGDPVRVKINEPTWQMTGVINGLPPRSISTGPTKRIQLKSDLEQRQKVLNELENGKAAELALKEVLASIRDVSARTIGQELFDFDPCSMTFPSLCLRILPAPSTLNSPTPFSTNESWSIGPPGLKQYEALNRVVHQRIALMKARANVNAVSTTPTSISKDKSHDRVFTHVRDAFSHWESLPEKQRQEAWQLEILRSFSRAEEARLKVEDELTATKQKLEALKSQMERVGHMITAADGNREERYYGSPLSQHAPLNLPTQVVKDLWTSKDVGVQHWEYEGLLKKWKNKVREDRQLSNGLVAQRSLSMSSASVSNQPRRVSDAPKAPSQASPIQIQKPSPAPANKATPQPAQDEDDESDSPDPMDEDASGESDEAEGEVDADADADDVEMSAAPAVSTSLQHPPPPQHQVQQHHLAPHPNIQPPSRTPSPNAHAINGHPRQNPPSHPVTPQAFAQAQAQAQQLQQMQQMQRANWQTHLQQYDMQRQQYDGAPHAPYMATTMPQAMHGFVRLAEGAGQQQG